MNPTDPSAAPKDSSLSRALDGLWQRFLPEIIARVTVLESAATAMAGSCSTPEQHEAAQAAAHKLAGVLGTFGLTRGTELAREIELALANQSSLDAETAPNLADAAAELREIVQSRQPSV